MVILNVFVLSDVDKSLLHLNWVGYREFVADSVIQATGTVEFEDGLRTVVHLGGCWGP